MCCKKKQKEKLFCFFNCRSHDVIFYFLIYLAKRNFESLADLFQNGVVTEVDRLETGGYMQHLAAYTKNFTKKFIHFLNETHIFNDLPDLVGCNMMKIRRITTSRRHYYSFYMNIVVVDSFHDFKVDKISFYTLLPFLFILPQETTQ